MKLLHKKGAVKSFTFPDLFALPILEGEAKALSTAHRSLVQWFYHGGSAMVNGPYVLPVSHEPALGMRRSTGAKGSQSRKPYGSSPSTLAKVGYGTWYNPTRITPSFWGG